MKCKKFKDWLYLYRDGELSPAQLKKLELHLDECPVCRRENRTIKRMASLVHQAKDEDPFLVDPESLTQRILNGVAGETPIQSTPALKFWGEKLFLKPAIRYAMTLTIMFIITVFAVQSGALLKRISYLERRMAEQTVDYTSFNISPAVIADIPNEWVLVKTSTIESLLRQHHPLSGRVSGYWRRIQREIPDMKMVSLEDGLSKYEMMLLLKKKGDILELIPNL